MAESRNADEIFREFKEHSIAEFFKKNRQMLGYSSMVRSLVTVVHEYVTNSLDAAEDAGILPDIEVWLKEIGENKYMVRVSDNGPGIPKKFVGKALATVLAGTKFHRYVQQRGQQGIGAAGATLFAQITTGKPIFVKSGIGKDSFSCHVSLDTMKNSAIVKDMENIDDGFRGLSVEAEFADVKYEQSEHGVYEYLKRTALSNPHCQIKFIDPSGKESIFMRSVKEMPQKSKPTQPHPLGLAVNDLLEFAHASTSRKISSFFVETFARTTSNKVAELKDIARGVDFEKSPKEMTWPDAEELIKAIKAIKWIAPDATSVIPIGEERIKTALKNILDPEFMNVVERKPRVFRGGVPFVIEAAVAYGGKAGYKTEDGSSGSILRFANRVPLLFDAGNCAITEGIKTIEWRRYAIDMETQPVSVFVNMSSVHIPYSGVGKEAIAKEDEVIEEIKLAVMEAARGVQSFIRGKHQANFESGKYKTTMRYAKQLAKDLAEMTGENEKALETNLEKIIATHYPHLKKAEINAERKGESAAREEEVGDAE